MEDGIDGTKDISDRIPVIPRNRKLSFRTLPRERKQLWIRFCGTKIEVNSHNSVPNPSAEENTTQNSIQWIQNRSKLSEFRSKPFCGRKHNSKFLFVQQKIKTNSLNAIPNHSAEEKPIVSKTRQPKILKIVSEKTTFVKLFCCCFVKLISSAKFHSVLFRSVPFWALELAIPRNSECLGMGAFFGRIMETVPRLFRGIGFS